MRKFSDVYKEKLNESQIYQENKVLDDFKKVYSAMLEQYNLVAVQDLNEESQLSFLTELKHYWSEEEGISEKGKRFLEKRSMSLNENSTAIQKKNFLKDKSAILINEVIRQSDLKYKIYDILDEIYKQTNAKDISGILPVQNINNVLLESFSNVIEKVLDEINEELTDSVKESKKKYYVKVKTK